MIAAIVLAAGFSSRMGRPKALLPLPAGGTFLSHLLTTLESAAVEDLVVVVGHQGTKVAAAVSEATPSARVVVNERYASGQLSSVIAGLDVVDRPDVDAILLTLVDVPLVSARTVRLVMERYRITHAPVVRPVQGARHGHPVLIDRSLFGALRALDPATGMKPLVRANVSPSGDVNVDDEGAFVDIDTPEDYQRLLGGA
jgi:CTP:molybdopterin cytidylyltransferase MocA